MTCFSALYILRTLGSSSKLETPRGRTSSVALHSTICRNDGDASSDECADDGGGGFSLLAVTDSAGPSAGGVPGPALAGAGAGWSLLAAVAKDDDSCRAAGVSLAVAEASGASSVCVVASVEYDYWVGQARAKGGLF